MSHPLRDFKVFVVLSEGNALMILLSLIKQINTQRKLYYSQDGLKFKWENLFFHNILKDKLYLLKSFLYCVSVLAYEKYRHVIIAYLVAL